MVVARGMRLAPRGQERSDPVRGREWLAAAAIGFAVVLAGALEVSQIRVRGAVEPAIAVFLLCIGVAVGVARWAPGVALGVAWAAGLIQIVGGVPVLLTELSLTVVLFAAARWGGSATLLLGAVSTSLAPFLALAWVRTEGVQTGVGWTLLFELLGAAGATARTWRLLLLGLTLVVVPFLVGLALRFLARARTAAAGQQTAEREAHQAQEIARLQEAQNRLARDVHDVVGHSLTVILAQAESAQFIDDPDTLKQTMQTIAASARTSLQDVRTVLTAGQESTAGRRGGLDTLIEQLRASGRAVLASQEGEARPLPPELETVAYRVLQEMLTNALKHGRRDQQIAVQRRWPDAASDEWALRITVWNTVDESPQPGAGQGIPGMRRRLEAVGGRL